MLKHLPKLTLISVITCGLLIQATPATAERTITCESRKGRYQYCNIKTGGRVKLRKQISNTRCREGDNWGYDRNGVWVDQGCSGEFSVRNRGNNNNNNNNNNNKTTTIIITTIIQVIAIQRRSLVVV